MKNYSSNRAQKGKTGFRTPHTWITERPEIMKKKNSSLFSSMKANNKKFKAHPGPFTH